MKYALSKTIANALYRWLTGQTAIPHADHVLLRDELEREKIKRRATEAKVTLQIQQATDIQQTVIQSLKADLASAQQQLRQLNNQIVSLTTKHSLSQSQLEYYTSTSGTENQRLLDMINWLSGTIAHDLRAPVRAIDAYTFFLADDLHSETNPEVLKTLAEIRRNGQRMGTLVDGLIEYMRIAVTPMIVSPVDTRRLVTEIVAELIVPVNITISETLPTVYGDKLLLKRVFENLLDNAVKFSRPVPAAAVHVDYDPGSKLFSVKDNGVGFDASHRNKLFKLFHRLHGNDEFEGEGIGLSVAQRIVERHYGQLNLERIGNRTMALFSLNLHPTLETGLTDQGQEIHIGR